MSLLPWCDTVMLFLQEFIAKYALQDPLSGPNVTVVLEILRALVNSSSLRQIEAFNNIMEELLLKLQKQENLHLITETTGRVKITTLICVFAAWLKRRYYTYYKRLIISPLMLRGTHSREM